MSSPSRPQSGVIAPGPDPAQRRREAGRVVARDVRPRQRCAAGGSSPANSGWASQRSANASMPPASISSASAASAARRAARSCVVLDPGGRRDEDQPADALGRGERDVQRDPAAHRVPAERRSAAAPRPARPAVIASNVTGRAPARDPWPRRSGSERRIAFARPARATTGSQPRPVPANPCRRTTRLAHPLIMPAPTDTYLLLRALCDELGRCGIAGAVTSPGSRSTPVVLSLARAGGLPVLLADRRAQRRVLRARARQGDRPARRCWPAPPARRRRTTCRR